ncbi:MAG: tetratricopeptide repeat protein [Saprospiraceae bacterium]
MKIFTNTLKSLITQNKIKLAMAVLADFWQDKNQASYNECLLLRSQWLQAEQDFTAGLIDRSEAVRVMNRVKAGLMHQAQEVAGKSFDLDQAMKRAADIQNRFAEEEVEVPGGKKIGWWVWLVALSVLVAGVWLGKDLFRATPAEAAQPPAVHKTLKDTLAEVAALREQADNLVVSNQEQQALALLNKAVSLQEVDYALYNQRADLYFKIGRYPDAEKDAERSIRLNPNFCMGYVTIAQIMTKRGRTEEFYTNIEKALKRNTEGKCNLWQLDELPGIIEHRTEPRFKELIAAYRPK